MSDFNTQVIDEFRANHGKLASFGETTMLLLHHKGAKTGTERVNPVAYQVVGGDYAIFASKAGAPTNPDWYYNLVANPDTKVEIGDETIQVHARVAEGDERQRIWTKQMANIPNFASYEEKTDRQIPVVILEPR